MGFNFFDWMREGVKNSVLRGVSEAVETMGMPEDEETSRAKILRFLKEDETQDVTPSAQKPRVAASTTANTPRKLGRSISEIHPAKAS